MKDTPISSRLPEKEKEHGYSVLVAPRKRNQEQKISPCSFEIKGARLLCFGALHFKNEEHYFEQKTASKEILDTLT